MKRAAKLLHADACRRARYDDRTPEAVTMRVVTLTPREWAGGAVYEARVSVPRLRWLERRAEERQTMVVAAQTLVGLVVGDPEPGRRRS